MAIDVLPEAQSQPERPNPANHQPAPARQPAPSSSTGRWLIRGVLGFCVIGAVVAIGVFAMGGRSGADTGPKLTHTIKRNSLKVTVTEQGTLESSNNTEIKCKVRGTSTVLWVVEPGTQVEPGDELVRLDTSTIEDNINTQKIAYQRALATHSQSEADVAVARIAITEYEEGTFRSSLKALQKDLAISESNLRAAKNMLEHSKRMFKRGYASQLEVEGNEFAVAQAELEIELKKTEIDVLERFTKAKEMETLQSALTAAEAKLASDTAALDLEKTKLEREEQQLENCVIVAETSGMVIYPSAAQWKEAPDIEEGATVRQDQVLLMIPDLTQMQVKVGIHESKVDRIKTGMDARVSLQDLTIEGQVASVATITKPAGWWTGNVVKYDTVIELDSYEGLKPGMSAGVEVILAEYEDVVTIPVAAVVETETDYYCWVKEGDQTQRRALQLGDSNDQFIVVEAGLKESDIVVLNPLAFIDEAQTEALKPLTDASSSKIGKNRGSAPAASESKSKPESKPESNSKPEEKPESSDSGGASKLTGAQILQFADKDGDGFISQAEDTSGDTDKFAETDTNGDGKLDEAELDAALKKAGVGG